MSYNSGVIALVISNRPRALARLLPDCTPLRPITISNRFQPWLGQWTVLRPLWLARVIISFVLVLRHSIQNCSITPLKRAFLQIYTKSYSFWFFYSLKDNKVLFCESSKPISSFLRTTVICHLFRRRNEIVFIQIGFRTIYIVAQATCTHPSTIFLIAGGRFRFLIWIPALNTAKADKSPRRCEKKRLGLRIEFKTNCSTILVLSALSAFIYQ